MSDYRKLVILVTALSGLFAFLLYNSSFSEGYSNGLKTIWLQQKDFKLRANTILLRPADYIYAYVNLPLSMDYGSNAIPLALAALVSPPGDMLELGMGLFSTPLLHKIAHDQQRYLVSVDTDLKWLTKFVAYNMTQNHKIYYLPTKEVLMSYGLDRNWSLVLVDHIFGESRPNNIIAFARSAQIVVAHDTEKRSESYYQYERFQVRNHFKYGCKFSLYTNELRRNPSYISTTVLSNYVDLVNLLKPALDKISTDYGHNSCDVSY